MITPFNIIFAVVLYSGHSLASSMEDSISPPWNSLFIVLLAENAYINRILPIL